MLEHWGADVNEAAVYYADPVAWSRHLQYSINTERAIPLFVAANNGHNGIVRYLVEKGADVSVRTRSIGRNYYDGLTPLYGTVIDLRFGNDNLIYQKRIKEENAGIVRFLLESGADASTPSSRLSDGSPVWKKNLCRADVITVLIHHDMDLKQRDQSANSHFATTIK